MRIATLLLESDRHNSTKLPSMHCSPTPMRGFGSPILFSRSDGFARRSVVNGSEGILIHDLAYYWPQYTPISSAADYNLMLFTVSKSTGHAGMRINSSNVPKENQISNFIHCTCSRWALVKDEDVGKQLREAVH
ncbi:hypothetical protein V6N13_041235 [Hibiscus sabdariffa]